MMKIILMHANTGAGKNAMICMLNMLKIQGTTVWTKQKMEFNKKNFFFDKNEEKKISINNCRWIYFFFFRCWSLQQLIFHLKHEIPYRNAEKKGRIFHSNRRFSFFVCSAMKFHVWTQGLQYN